MLTFEQKQQIIESFPELTRKEVSMKRLNYHYEDSLYDKTVVVQHLHPNGNGFVYVAGIPGYEADDRGLVNIREATEEELKATIRGRHPGSINRRSGRGRRADGRRMGEWARPEADIIGRRGLFQYVSWLQS